MATSCRMATLSQPRASCCRRTPHKRARIAIAAHSSAEGRCSEPAAAHEPAAAPSGRRQALSWLAAVAATALAVPAAPAAAAEPPPFVRTDSGLLIQDISVGQGRQPQPGDRVAVHYAGYTKNYQAKRFANTSRSDEPFEFVLGRGEVIPAFEEAVAGMKVGGVRRVEVPGELPELSYPRDPKERFAAPFKYRYGPQPTDLGGQRALDFILDNPTLSPTNRTLLLDIKLLAVRQ